MTGVIFDIQRFSLHDGPGIRTTVFFKGCDLRCLWCHNPESQSPTPELLFYEHLCVGCGACRTFCGKAFTPACTRRGDCAEVCRYGAREKSGRTVTVEETLATVLRDRRFYETSGGGVTLSGGEPLLQPDFAYALLSGLKAAGAHTAIETAAHVPRETLERALPMTDLVLCDIKGIDGDLHRQNTGVSNRRILENARFLMANAKALRFRFPYIPGFNDGEAEAVRAFTKGFELELMPYHETGAGKYRALARPYPAEAARVPTREEMTALSGTLGALYEPQT